MRIRRVFRAIINTLETNIDNYDLETPVLEIGSGKKTMRLRINQQDNFVRCVLNNSRLEQVGGCFGGWYQRSTGEHRLNLSMDDWRTSKADHFGLHIVIFYAKAGINYWAKIKKSPLSCVA